MRDEIILTAGEARCGRRPLLRAKRAELASEASVQAKPAAVAKQLLAMRSIAPRGVAPRARAKRVLAGEACSQMRSICSAGDLRASEQGSEDLLMWVRGARSAGSPPKLQQKNSERSEL